MYLKYMRKGCIEDCVFRYVYGGVEIATEGDFRKGYITFSHEDFEEMFMSKAVEVLEHKPRKPKMKNYLLNVTFYAGSDDEEDTDRSLFLLSVNKEITENKMKDIFKEVNGLLDTFDEDTDFPISYEQGLNIYTLMEGIKLYINGKIVEVNSNYGKLDGIDNYYMIEQWQ